MSEEEDIVKWLKRRRLTDVDYLDYNSVENIIKQVINYLEELE